jgi:hypothetical protein
MDIVGEEMSDTMSLAYRKKNTRKSQTVRAIKFLIYAIYANERLTVVSERVGFVNKSMDTVAWMNLGLSDWAVKKWVAYTF